MSKGINSDVGATNPVIISNLVISALTGSSVTFTWSTQIPATSQVLYGVYPNLDQKSPEIDLSTLVTSHTVTLIGLVPNTSYLFQVVSRQAGTKDGLNNPVIDGYQAKLGGNFVTKNQLSPTDIPGLVAWYDAGLGLFTDIAKTVPSVNPSDLVRCWSDQSGNGHDLTQSGNCPRLAKFGVSNQNAITFVSIPGQYLSAALSIPQPFSFFVYCGRAQNVSGLFKSVLGSDNFPTGGIDFSYYVPSLTVQIDGPPANIVSAPETPAFAIYAGIVNGNQSQIFINGNPVGSGNAGTFGINNLLVGANTQSSPTSFMDGSMLEIILASGVLDTAHINSITAYLQQKWSLY